ncbi:MAG: L,D-transpeptidase [Chlorobiota bacterium]|nr:L,D-transpeptidase [Chlorobiota bacterium]QQS67321.1 MAG: L,D-transpeptidase [Chlorobiota bacterium]
MKIIYLTIYFFLALSKSIYSQDNNSRIEWKIGSRPSEISLNQFVHFISKIKLDFPQQYSHPYIQNGWNFCKDTLFTEALIQFNMGFNSKNSNVDLLWGKGLAFAGLKNYDSSLTYLWSAYNLNVDNIYLIMSIGNIYEQMDLESKDFGKSKYLDSALEVYKNAFLLYPKYDYLFYCWGRALSAKGDFSESINKFNYAKILGYKVENDVIMRFADAGKKFLEASIIAELSGFNSRLDLLIYINVEEQNMFVSRNNSIVKAFRVSTGKTGSEYGAKMGTNQTPLGIHKIVDKIGDGAEFGSIFKSRRNTGRIAPIVKDSAGLLSKLHDYVLTRVFIIDGLEDGINKGRDMNGKLVDSKARCIYIHGTNNELMLGTPVSYGCIRMFNDDAIELFNLVPIGTYVIIE